MAVGPFKAATLNAERVGVVSGAGTSSTLAAGADICGIGPMSRFDGAPDEMNPQFLFPEAKSVIGFIFRIPRGVQRGIEEGTFFGSYAYRKKTA